MNSIISRLRRIALYLLAQRSQYDVLGYGAWVTDTGEILQVPSKELPEYGYTG